jgi:hypothetical protein
MFGRLFLSIILVSVVCLAQTDRPLHADENRLGIIRMNVRVFDVGVDPALLRRDPDFIPLNRIPWLEKHLDKDPLLKSLVIQIRVLNHPADHLWGFPGPGKIFSHEVTLAEHLILEGYSVKSASPDVMNHLLFIPKDDTQSFSVSCHVDRQDSSEFSFCSVAAAYPPDPQIFLSMRIYDPQQLDDFPRQLIEIVKSVRKIVYCLDVTDGIHQDAGVANNLSGTPDCNSEFIG